MERPGSDLAVDDLVDDPRVDEAAEAGEAAKAREADEADGPDEAEGADAAAGQAEDAGGAVGLAARAGGAVGPAAPALTEREAQILAFERRWWKHAGSKEQAIRDTFGLSATRYYQVLNGLLDNPAAFAHEPVLVGRLRRLRSTRARSRVRR
jgi:hypothetical protein